MYILLIGINIMIRLSLSYYNCVICFTMFSNNPLKNLQLHSIKYLYDNRLWEVSYMPYFSDPYLDSQSSPLVRSGLLGTTRIPQVSGTCISWGGIHYRTFDKKHFHFQGNCMYLLASSTDGTWAVYISTVCDQRGKCNKVIFIFLSHIIAVIYFT